MGKNEVEIVVTAEDKASGTLKGITGSLGSIGKIAGGAALGGIGALVGGFAVAGSAAIDMNSQLETSTLQFATLMGDSDKAAAHVKSLFDFAAKTPFETGPIIEASRQLQVFGGDALNTEDNLTRIGDTAAAVGAPIEDISFWVGRAYSAIQGGQPFGEAAQNLMQMGAVSPDVIQQMKDLEAAGASADEIFAVLQGSMDEMAGAMEAQAGTWEGLKSTITDNLNMAAATALKPFFDMAKEGLAGFSEWISSPAIQEGIATFAEKVGEVVQAVADFVSGLLSGEDPVGDFANLFYELSTTFGATSEQATNVFNAVRQMGDKIIEFITPIWNAVTQFVSFKDVLIALGIAVASVVIPAIIGIVTSMLPIILVFGAVIAVVALLRNAWENNWGGIQEKTQAVIDFIKPLIQTALDNIKTWWDANGAAVMAAVQTAWQTIQTVVTTVITTISQIVSTILAAIQAFWQAHGETILATATQFWELIKGVIDGVVQQIQIIIDLFRAAFEGNWYEFGQKLFELWDNAWTTIVEFLGGLWDLILPYLTQIWEAFVLWFQTTDWGALAKNIINGLVVGIQNGIAAVEEAIRGLINAALARFGIELDSESPSRETMYYGEMAALGLATGIRNGIGKVQGAVSDMMGAAGLETPGFGFGGASLGTQAATAPQLAATGAGQTTVVNIDARGAERGVERDLRAMIEQVMREYGARADLRIRTS